VAGFCSLSFADNVTLTTYYPAPFGMYQEMRVMGKLGVGTTDPTSIVTVKDASGVYSPTGLDPLGVFVTSTANKPALAVVSADSAGVMTPNAGNVGLYAYGADYAGYFFGGKTYFQQNVGIGTTDPQRLLELRGNAADAGILRLSNENPSGWAGIGFYNADNTTLVGGTGLGNTNSITHPDSVYLGTTSVGGTIPVVFETQGVERARITSDGNVGIATTAPGYPLQVGDPTSTVPASTNGIAVAIKNDLWVDGNIYSTGGGGEWTRNSSKGWLYPATLTDNVGIGTNTPRAKLDVNPALSGSMDMVKKASVLSVGNYGSGSVSGTATAQVYGTMLVSDAASFGGKAKFFKDIQLVSPGPLGATAGCTANTDIGKMRFYVLVGGAGHLAICDYEFGILKWVDIKTWNRGGSTPTPSLEPQVFID